MVLYGLPDHCEFHNELLAALAPQHGGGEGRQVCVMYCWRDLLALQRVVGDKRAESMVASAKTTVLFEVG